MDIDKQHSIDTFFHDSLYDLEMEVPAGIFGKIEQHMEEKKRKRVLGYFYSIAASIAILIALGTGYFVGMKHASTNLATNTAAPTKTEPKEIESTAATINTTIQNKLIAKNTESQLFTKNDLETNTDYINSRQMSNKEVVINHTVSSEKNATSTSVNKFNNKKLAYYTFSTKSVVIKNNLIKENDAFAQQQIEDAVSKEFTAAKWQKNLKIEEHSPIAHSSNYTYVPPIGSSLAYVPNNTLNRVAADNPALSNFINSDYKNTASLAIETSSASVNSYKPAQYKEQAVKVSYTEIPVTGRYTIVNKGLTLSLSGGVSALVPNFSSVYNFSSVNNRNSQNQNYNGIFGVSMQLPLLKNLNFNMEPSMHYPLGSNGNNSTFRIYSGVKYSF